MLTRLLRGTILAAAVAAALVVLPQTAAQANGPGGGGPLGNVQCGQSYTPGCVITVGRPGSSGTTPGSTGQPGSTLPATGGVSPPGGCAGTTSAQFGCVPAGCQITAQTLGCAIPPGTPAGCAAPGGCAPAPALPPPGVLAQWARRYLVLPSPVIRSSPAQVDLQLTQLPTWLWISQAMWAPQSKTAAVAGESVTATATPVSVTWHPGDGSTVTCHGPGIAYISTYSPSSPSPDCGHTYSRSSAGQPGGAYHVTATITWDITWTGTGGAGGALPPLFTTAAAAFRVAESQAVNTSSGG
jgi:hypothetical protein